VSGPVVINARAAERERISGVERWAVEMAERLPSLRPGGYAVVAPRHPRLAYEAGHLWEQFVLPLRARRLGARTVFSPANVAPVAGRNVVVLHDAVMLRHPEWYSRAYRLTHEPLLRALARTADRVIVPSAFSADELSDLAGVPADRIDVVPGGVDERFHAGADPAPAREAFGLDRPYVLTVGGSGARKNLEALGPLARELRERGYELLAAGFVRPHLTGTDQVSGVRGLGYVPEELLPGLYAGAGAFVLPSLHEGFGLPCIEAMRAGVPVAATNRGAVPEACDGAAVHFEPTDHDAIAAVVLELLEDQGQRERLREAGLARAAQLTWDRAARSVDAILWRAS
jgi:glycosyltransferase involved in cell wall biosynthesis